VRGALWELQKGEGLVVGLAAVWGAQWARARARLKGKETELAMGAGKALSWALVREQEMGLMWASLWAAAKARPRV